MGRKRVNKLELKSRSKKERALKRLKSSALSVVKGKQKGLSIDIENDILVIRGNFFIFEGGKPYNKYEVLILIDHKFPLSEPIVCETGKKIPRIEDRHINGNGTCCLGLWEEWRVRETDHSVANFLNTILHDYFVQQDYFDRSGKWPFDDRSHGSKGMIESYAELLGIKANKNKVQAYLSILCGAWPKGHADCPCGSGKRLRECHREDLWEIHKRIPKQIAKIMLKRVKAEFSRQLRKR